MLRLNRPFPPLLLGIVMIYANQAGAQALDPSGLPQWDSTNQVLFFGRNGVEFGSPGYFVRGYVDVHQRGADIDLFKDFPGLREAIVNGLTAGPQGTTLIAADLNFGDRDIRAAVLTYDSSGRLLKTWSPARQYAAAIAYSRDDDALFVLGEPMMASDAPNAPDYPLLIEYSRDGRVLKSIVPARTLKDGVDSFSEGGEIGQPALRVTKDRIYFYAPTNREVVICDRGGVVLAHRNISDIVDKISTKDGYHLVQVHQVDFSDDGHFVLELLLSSDKGYTLDVVRININTGETAFVHKAFNSGELRFIGVKNGQYLYIADGRTLYIQSDEAQEPEPLTMAIEDPSRVH